MWCCVYGEARVVVVSIMELDGGTESIIEQCCGAVPTMELGCRAMTNMEHGFVMLSIVKPGL